MFLREKLIVRIVSEREREKCREILDLIFYISVLVLSLDVEKCSWRTTSFVSCWWNDLFYEHEFVHLWFGEGLFALWDVLDSYIFS